MSMQTDQYGNQGHWLKKGTTTPCDAVPTIRNEQCYFSKDVLAVGRGGFGVNVIQREDDFDPYEDNRLQVWGGCIPNDPDTGVDESIAKSDCDLSSNKWDPNHLKKGMGDDSFVGNTMGDTLDTINNGRVPDINIFDNVTVTRRGDVTMKQDNQEMSVKGIVEETALSNIFFSEQNTKSLHDTLRYEVYRRTNLIVDYQSEKDLYIIMRSILLQHANFKVSSEDLLNEIHKLNKLVISYSAHEVGSNVLQYKGYIRDLSKQPPPLDRPSFVERDRRVTFDLSSRIGL
jgi:hypothetical protein|tara:strand:+ start:1067 stop:1927 length:861 start_codon:yes stop_codon:yes gene_type:complete